MMKRILSLVMILIALNLISGCISISDDNSEDEHWIYYISEYRNHLNIDQIENELNHENITDINQYTMEEYLFGPIHEEGVRFNFSFQMNEINHSLDCCVKNNLHIDEGDDLASVININFVTNNEDIIESIRPFFFEIGNYIEDIIEENEGITPYDSRFEVHPS